MEPLLSEDGRKYRIMGTVIVLSIILFFGFIGGLISWMRGSLDLSTLLIVFGAIFLLAIVAEAISYLSLPSEIVRIDSMGFVYRAVSGSEKHIEWKSIIQIDTIGEKGHNDYYIKLKAVIFNKWIEIRADVGEEIKKAWEKWKEGENELS